MSEALWQEYVRYGLVTKWQLRRRTAVVWCIQVPLYAVVGVMALVISIMGYPFIGYYVYRANKRAFDQPDIKQFCADKAQEYAQQNRPVPSMYRMPPNKVFRRMGYFWPIVVLPGTTLTLDSLPHKWQDAKDRFVKTGHWKHYFETDDGLRPDELEEESDCALPDDLWADFEAAHASNDTE